MKANSLTGKRIYKKNYETPMSSISNINIELAGIEPVGALPYPSDGGMYNVIFPPELIKGIPFCHPTINWPSVKFADAPAAV